MPWIAAGSLVVALTVSTAAFLRLAAGTARDAAEARAVAERARKGADI